MTYEDIVKFLAKKYNIGEMACERIIDSQFKVVVEHIQQRNFKTINLIKLGKFTPVGTIKRKYVEKKNDTINPDSGGLVQVPNREAGEV